MSGDTAPRSALPLLIVPLVLLLLYPMDLAPGRYLVTFRADNFDPWLAENDLPSFNPDCLQSYYPRRLEARRALLAGRLPLWDPDSFCGQPFLANLQSGVLYPVNLLLLPFSAERSLGIYVWLHLLLAGVGMYLFLSSLRLTRSAVVAGALLFAVNGALASRTGQSTMLATAAWFPMILYLARRTLAGGGLAALAFGWACMFLAGFPPILVWGFALAAAWSLWCWYPERRVLGAGAILRVAGGFLLGFGLAAFQLLPTVEFIAHSDRVRFAYDTLLSSSWHPAALVRLVLPGFFGSPIGGEDWTHLLERGNGHYFQSFISTAAYVGMGTLLLAAGGAASWKRSRAARFFVIAGSAALLVLLGTPLLRVVSEIPGLGGARVDRIVHVPAFALAVLAAIGFHRIARGQGGRWIVAGSATLATAVLVLTLSHDKIALALAGPPVLPYLQGTTTLAQGAWALASLAATAAAALWIARGGRGRRIAIPVAIAVLVADPGLVSRRCHVTVEKEALPSETPGIRFLAERADRGRVVRYEDHVLPPNLPGIFGLRDVAGYNALNIKYYRRYFSAMAPPSVKERRINPLKAVTSVQSPLLDRLAARWVISAPATEPPDLPMVYDGEMRVYENTTAYPRAFLTYRLATVKGPGAALQLLSHPLTPRFTTCLEWEEVTLEPDEKGAATVGDWVKAHGGDALSFEPGQPLDDTARIVLDEPERIGIDCASKGGRMLVLADTWYPGWIAEVDGRETEIHRVNRTLRGVVVPGGVHRVEFRYEPPSFRIGVVLSVLSMLAVAALAVRRGRRVAPGGGRAAR